MDRRTWAMLGKSVSAGLLAGLLTAKVNSAVLVDFSPDFIGASVGCCVAQAEGTYLQHFDLSQSTTLTGFAYYVENNGHVPAVGNQLFVTITQGPFQVGQPPASSVYHFLTVTVASNQFPGATASNYGDFYGLTGVFAPLPSILLAAGTYWVGFNGDSGAFAPATFGFALLSGQNAPFNDPMPVLDATGKYGTPASPPVGTMAMRLYGDVVTVPEPGTLALLAGSFALFGLIGRRRRPVKLPKNYETPAKSMVYRFATFRVAAGCFLGSFSRLRSVEMALDSSALEFDFAITHHKSMGVLNCEKLRF